MKVTTEPTSDSQVVLNVEVDPEDVEKSVNRAYQRIVQRANIPGFRKGKAPRALIERRFGKDSLYREALDFLLPEAYNQALRESNVEALAEPDVEIVQLGPDKPFIFKATVPLRPTVDPGDYRGIRLQPEDTTATDEDVQAEVDRLRERHAQWVPVSGRTAHRGDRVTVDYEIVRAGAPESKVEDAELVLGEDEIFEGFAAQIEGAFVGQELTARHTQKGENSLLWVPDQEVLAHVKLKAIKEQQLPEPDDDLAKTVGDFNTLDELKEHMHKTLTFIKEMEGRAKFSERLVEMAVERAASLTFPPVMVEEEIDELVAQSRRRLSQQGVQLEGYLESAGKTMEQFREDLREDAIQRVKRDLVLVAIGEAEKIEVSSAEVREGVDATLSNWRHERKRDVERARNNPRLHAEVRRSILRRKTLDFLAEIAKAKEEAEGHVTDPDGH